MSLSALSWRRLPTVTVTTSTAAGVLDHIWSVLGSGGTTYYDGSTRTVGAGSAATWARFQNAGTTEALYATPVTDTLTHRLIIAGVNAVRTPAMASPDTYSSNTLMISLNKNSGAFASWDHASAPFTSGSFFGYWKLWNAGGTAASKIYCFEAQEAVAVFIEDTGGNVYGACWGAIFDPESTDTTSDAESDGKLYGILTSGTSAIAANINIQGSGASTLNSFTCHATANGQSHVGCFQPGTATLLTLFREQRNVSTTTSLRTTSGRYQRAPLLYSSRAAAPNDRFIGRLREVQFGVDGKIGGVYRESSADVAYLIGGSSTADQDSLWLSR